MDKGIVASNYEDTKETSWLKIIVILIIGIIFLLVTIFGLLQNYYAVKAIADISKLGTDDFITTTQTSIQTRECYENNVKVNCSEFDNQKGGN